MSTRQTSCRSLMAGCGLAYFLLLHCHRKRDIHSYFPTVVMSFSVNLVPVSQPSAMVLRTGFILAESQTMMLRATSASLGSTPSATCSGKQESTRTASATKVLPTITFTACSLLMTQPARDFELYRGGSMRWLWLSSYQTPLWLLNPMTSTLSSRMTRVVEDDVVASLP